MLIFVDVDSTVAELMPAWLKLYNEEFSDSLTPEDIIEWEISKFVKPECGKKIYSYLGSDRLYGLVKPIDGAVSGVMHLRDLGHRVVFASAGSPDAKVKWLKEHGFDPGQWNCDFVSAYDKSLLRGDMLIDDKPENVIAFNDSNRTVKSILFNQPWNATTMWGSRANSWHDVTYKIAREGSA